MGVPDKIVNVTVRLEPCDPCVCPTCGGVSLLEPSDGTLGQLKAVEAMSDGSKVRVGMQCGHCHEFAPAIKWSKAERT